MGCECELKPEEIEVLKSIFEIVLEQGRSPTTDELRLSLKKSNAEVVCTLDKLEKKGDFFLRKKGTQEIVSVYPLSLTPTPHRIILEDGTRLFAMCAVDALGVPLMFNKNVKILSQCEKCDQEITIEIINEKITSVSHPDITICSPKSQIYPAAETTCPLVNFFCSKKHAQEWILENPKLGDNIKQSSIKRVFPRIKHCWKSYGKILGFQ